MRRIDRWARWALVGILGALGTASCRQVRPDALPHPLPVDAWRAGEDVSPPASAGELSPEVSSDALEEPGIDRSKLDPRLLQEISLHAENTTLTQIILTLAKQAGANVTVDKEVTGETSVQFTRIPLVDAVEQLSRPFGYGLSASGLYLHVFKPTLETRVYQVNFPGASRKGDMKVTVSDRVIAASMPIPGATTGSSGSDTGSSTSIQTDASFNAWKDASGARWPTCVPCATGMTRSATF